MGCGTSALRKEIAALRVEIEQNDSNHRTEIETLKKEKRTLEEELRTLENLAAQAQVESEKAKKLINETEERLAVLKWELARKLTSPSNSPRVSANWKLKDGVQLRRSSKSNAEQSISSKEEHRRPTLTSDTSEPSSISSKLDQKIRLATNNSDDTVDEESGSQSINNFDKEINRIDAD